MNKTYLTDLAERGDLFDWHEADRLHPGPWDFRHYGQNGYEIVDARGVTLERGRDGYDDAEDDRREQLVAEFNLHVASVLSGLTEKEGLSKEFSSRKKGLISRKPIFAPESAQNVGEIYRKAGYPLVGDAISGVRYGKKLLSEIRRYESLSKDEKGKKTFSMAEFGMGMAEGYFSPESLGVTKEELHDLLGKIRMDDVRDIVDIIKNGNYADERSLFEYLICSMNLAGVDYSFFPLEDQEFLRTRISFHEEGNRQGCLMSARNFLGQLRDGGRQAIWYRLKWYVIAGGFSADELDLTPEERKKLDGVLF